MALRALAENVDRRFQALEGCFYEIADMLDALAIGANRNRNDDRRQPRDEVARVWQLQICWMLCQQACTCASL